MTQPYECEVRFGIDDIEGLGWTAELEFEGKDPQKAGSAIYLQNKAPGGTTRG